MNLEPGDIRYGAQFRGLRATICEATQTCDPPPHGVSVLSLPEHTKRERVFIEYRNPALYEPLWQLLYNGRKLTLRPMRYSVKRMVQDRKPE
jgi:hypothetical protein